MTLDAKPVRCAFQIYCIWWLALLIESSSRSERIPDEQRLYRDLLANYESAVRPVHNASSVVNIGFRISLNQIVDLDERTQVLTTNVFIDQCWQDENLVWNTTNYSGIKTLRVPASYIWLPDTFIFNNADDASTGFMHSVYVLVRHNGSVLWPVPVKLLSSCKVDITFFPFDDQTCELHFGSWIYSADWIYFNGTVDSFDLTNYVDNSEWKLLAINFQKNGGTDVVSRPVLIYALHMRRRTFYYIFNIIVPCVMLSVLTLLTFWLPPTSGEKVSLGLSVFLAFSMFMLLIAEEVPATSESVPLIDTVLCNSEKINNVEFLLRDRSNSAKTVEF
ncbi:Neuronal acetylcholine receptor subunit alpha-10 [Lamellibrachia satsuma]|nr:Neuronal acetylcholine receptor subunit alpha-10 [Lamellibrachia satsuma]